MTDTLRATAEAAVDEILDDLTDRRGLKHEWHNIDADIQAEIKAAWADAIHKALQAQFEACAKVAADYAKAAKNQQKAAAKIDAAGHAERIEIIIRALAIVKGSEP